MIRFLLRSVIVLKLRTTVVCLKMFLLSEKIVILNPVCGARYFFLLFENNGNNLYGCMVLNIFVLTVK